MASSEWHGGDWSRPAQKNPPYPRALHNSAATADERPPVPPAISADRPVHPPDHLQCGRTHINCRNPAADAAAAGPTPPKNFHNVNASILGCTFPPPSHPRPAQTPPAT